MCTAELTIARVLLYAKAVNLVHEIAMYYYVERNYLLCMKHANGRPHHTGARPSRDKQIFHGCWLLWKTWGSQQDT
jgi:hypothetical protein